MTWSSPLAIESTAPSVEELDAAYLAAYNASPTKAAFRVRRMAGLRAVLALLGVTPPAPTKCYVPDCDEQGEYVEAGLGPAVWGDGTNDLVCEMHADD